MAVKSARSLLLKSDSNEFHFVLSACAIEAARSAARLSRRCSSFMRCRYACSNAYASLVSDRVRSYVLTAHQVGRALELRDHRQHRQPMLLLCLNKGNKY